MDWQLLGVSFLTIFLAELGDKSQVAAIALGGSSKFPQSVFFGTAGALLLASLLGVLAGEGVAQLLPAHLLKAIAAIGFTLMALRLLFGKDEDEDEDEQDSSSEAETPAIALCDPD